MSSELTVDREPEKRKVQRELSHFRTWFSILTFLLTAVAFAIGFPALEDAGKKIGLGSLAFGLPFAIDLGMVTLLLWSMWNRGVLKPSWPPLIPAAALLGLSSWLQYIHAVELIPEDATPLAHWGFLILASSLPLLLALSAGVFEAVTFAPLIDRVKRHTELLMQEQEAADELWTVESEERRKRAELEANLKRKRLELETNAELQLLEAETEAAMRALRGNRPAPKAPKPLPKTPAKAVKEELPPATTPAPTPAEEPVKPAPEAANPFAPKVTPPVEQKAAPVPENKSVEIPSDDALAAAVDAVTSGRLSQRAASEEYGVSRSKLRRRLEDIG